MCENDRPSTSRNFPLSINACFLMWSDVGLLLHNVLSNYKIQVIFGGLHFFPVSVK